MFHLHRWSDWTAHENYIDSSWGDQVRSTQLIRRCRCGDVRAKHLYGVVLPTTPAAQHHADPNQANGVTS